ncbi:MAG: CAP domain-containing protein, partial [Acidiferrobacterales bacterium]|nr:CAP domain-containing protein [Acidiferrobacterales bacterium]
MFQMSGVTSLSDFASALVQRIARGAKQIINTAEASKPTARTHVVKPASLVATHNKWRKKVGVPPLSWSGALAKDAQAWAEALSKKNCKMRHSKQRQHGENIFWASAKRWSDGRREVQNISAEFVVNDWGSEVRDYNYKKNKCRRRRQCGHYTQVVSRRTQKVGCGMAVCADKGQVWVCRYDPPGNIVGRKPY